MIRGSHDPTDPNFIAKDNGLSDSHLHGNMQISMRSFF